MLGAALTADYAGWWNGVPPKTTPTLPSGQVWNSIAYGNGVYVAVGQNSNVAATSTDGVTWTSRTLPSTDAWSTTTYGNGLFVTLAYGTNKAATSPDGVTWTARTLPVTGNWYAIAYGNSTFVATADTGTNVVTSTDGITWNNYSINSRRWLSMTYANGNHYAMNYDGGTDSIAVSSDGGANWTYNSGLTAGLDWIGIVYANNTFVAVNENSANPRIASSTNASAWSIVTVTQPSRAITYGNGLFVAMPGITASNVTQVSPNGYNWSTKTLPSSNTYYDIAYGPGATKGFVATQSGITNAVSVSRNGSTWY